MSITHKVFFGPYLRCKPRPEPVEVSIRGCNNKKCPLFRSNIAGGNFCAGCGARIELLTWTGMGEVPDLSELSDMLDDVLTEVADQDADFPGGVHIWVPNAYPTDSPRGFGLEEGGAYPIQSDDVIKEIEWLKVAYAREVKILRREYGADNVTVEFGVVMYCL